MERQPGVPHIESSRRCSTFPTECWQRHMAEPQSDELEWITGRATNRAVPDDGQHK